MSISVLFADTELLYRAGAADALAADPAIDLRTVVQEKSALEQALLTEAYDVALVALPLIDDVSGFASQLHTRHCALVLLLNPGEEPALEDLSLIRAVLRRSADAEQLCDCVRTIAAGRPWSVSTKNQPALPLTAGERVLKQLTPRQIRVIAGVSRGSKNADIAQKLRTTEQVVKNMLREIYDLTGVSDRLELALFVLHQRELADAVDQVIAESFQTPSG